MSETDPDFFGGVLHLVRVTLEAVTPLSIGDADNAAETDHAVVRDANGLPTIPGASIAGVLHHLYRSAHGGAAADELFGFIRENEDKGRTARLTFGWGCVHDSNDRAVQGLLLAPPSDPLLVALSDDEPVAREHVALDHRGVVAGRGKFDRAAVPRGTRFSFEISMWGRAETADADKERLAELVGLMAHPAFRLGGGARRGYGAVRFVENHVASEQPRRRIFHRMFEIGGENAGAEAKKLRECRGQPPSCHQDFGPLASNCAAGDGVKVSLALKPRGLWRIGTGDTAFAAPDRAEGEDQSAGQDNEAKPADMLLLTEPWVEWTNGVGELPQPDSDTVRLLIPGASIKGPLAHRILFHYNRLEGRFVDAGVSTKEDIAAQKAKAEDWASRASSVNADLAQLLGLAKSRGADRGAASRIIVDDCIVSVARNRIGRINHNRIDRFTQGVITGGLFAEEAAYGGDWAIELTILRRKPQKGEAPRNEYGYAPKVWQALEAAVADLCEGRLALGAKSMGFAAGSAKWDAAKEQAGA